MLLGGRTSANVHANGRDERENVMSEQCLRILIIGLAFAVAMPIVAAKAEIKTQTIDYQQGDATLEGYLAYDDATAARRPGIIVAHEWGGLTAYEKMRSEALAKLGYARSWAAMQDFLREAFAR